MRVEKITVSRTKKVNLGNFESAEILVSMTADVDTAENPLEVGAKLAAMGSQIVQEHGPKDLEQRAKERSPKKEEPKGAEPAPAPVPATPEPESETVATKIRGIGLQKDAVGRLHLKNKGFHFDGVDSWIGKIPRGEIKEMTGWARARGLDIAFGEDAEAKA